MDTLHHKVLPAKLGQKDLEEEEEKDSKLRYKLQVK